MPFNTKTIRIRFDQLSSPFACLCAPEYRPLSDSRLAIYEAEVETDFDRFWLEKKKGSRAGAALPIVTRVSNNQKYISMCKSSGHNNFTIRAAVAIASRPYRVDSRP